MPVYQELVNLDRVFAQLKETPIIINDLVNCSEDEKESVLGLIRSKYSSDMLSILPTCQCGDMKGEYAVGEICNNCGTVVKPTIDEDIEPIAWFRAPKLDNDRVIKLINPIIYLMLKEQFSKSNFSLLQWLCDTTYRVTVKPPTFLQNPLIQNMPRGYINFYENFDYIISTLLMMKEFRATKKKRADYLLDLINTKRECVFSQYLPLPNRSLLMIEKTNVGQYVVPNITTAVDAILTVVGIDNPNNPVMSIRAKENRTFKTLNMLYEFYETFNKDSLTGKPSILRKHVFGSRTHFSFRAVISSITDRHNYDEIYIPWGIALTVLRVHLMNKLLKLGYEHNQAIGFLHGHVEKYNPLLDRLLNELINESPYKGIPVMLQRNPSMLSGSAQLVYITRVKKDPTIHTVSMSILIVRAPNADFDGDALNFSLSIDNFLTDKWYNLAPHKNVMVVNRPREISNNINMPKTVIATIANWATSKSGYAFTDEQIANFNALPEAP